MKLKTGKPVRRYDGVIPKSGKAVIDFAGHKLVHRSIKKDKSDLLVHVASGIVLRAYPIGTDRSIVLDDMAKNIDKLYDFVNNPDDYEIVGSDAFDTSSKKKDKVEKEYDTYKEPSYSRQGKFAHLNQDTSCVTGSCSSSSLKKTFNLKDAKWN